MPAKRPAVTVRTSSTARRPFEARPLGFRILDSLSRGARLLCPCCGHGRLFRSGFTMYERCTGCDEKFEREPGQSFGAVYINLGLTMALVLIGHVLTSSLTGLTQFQHTIIWTPVAALAPVLFFRLAKGLWTSIVFLGEGLYLDWPNR